MPDPTARAVEFSGDLKTLSVGVAILLVSYAAGLLFSLKTHTHLFNPSHDEDDHGGEPWTVRSSVLMLAGAGAAVGGMSEILVSSITEASASLGLSRSSSASSSSRSSATPPSTGCRSTSPQTRSASR